MEFLGHGGLRGSFRALFFFGGELDADMMMGNIGLPPRLVLMMSNPFLLLHRPASFFSPCFTPRRLMQLTPGILGHLSLSSSRLLYPSALTPPPPSQACTALSPVVVPTILLSMSMEKGTSQSPREWMDGYYPWKKNLLANHINKSIQ